MHPGTRRLHVPRSWGQNFLVNQGAADTIVTAFRPRPGDRVLEIGPGRGVLTRRLAGRVARLLAVEIDPALAGDLRADLASVPGVEVLEADVLDVDLAARLAALGAGPGSPARVVANLPYAIATAVILRLLAIPSVSDLLVLVQREVGERIGAAPGGRTYGSLSILCQARARVETLLRLKPGSFRPIPKVESVLVRLTIGPPEGPPVDLAALEALLRAAFAQRRKTLLNNLSRLSADGAPLGAARATTLIRSAGLEPGARPEQIPVAGFLALLDRLRDL